MNCGAIGSGDRFLASTIEYLDCTGRTLGSAGYQSLATAPVIGSVLLAFLTLFIAVQGLRLMFGRPLDFGDATFAAAKIGFVLMLAVSWPAVQTLIHGTVIEGPRQLVERLEGGVERTPERMQRIDSGIVALTSWGTGKLDIRVGRTASGQPVGSAFTGEVTNESLGFSVGRLLFMTGVLLSLGTVSLSSGLLIALLPFFAGFLLFDQTRGLFFGWAKAMAFLFFAGVAAPAILIIQGNVMEPWLQRLIAERQQFLATPSAPIELIALSTLFLLLLGFSFWLLSRVCFNSEFTAYLRQAVVRLTGSTGMEERPVKQASTAHERFAEVSRATQLASVLDVASRREPVRVEGSRRELGNTGRSPVPSGSSGMSARAGTSGRRPQPREAASRARRDQR